MTATTTTAAEQLHRDSIVIDAVCPLLRSKDKIEWYLEGQASVVCPTVALWETAAGAFREIAGWKKFIQDDKRLRQVRNASEIEAAKRDGVLGILFHFQNSDPIEEDLNLVAVYKELGVSIIQLCYNLKNRAGDGADERTDAGLSHFGVDLIHAMNEARIIVDCSHTGIRTSFDAIEVSRQTVIISHGNPRKLHDSKRNLPDDLIKAIAQQGGAVGIVGFPYFISSSQRPTLDQFIDHIVYVADLVGIDHVGLGIDYYNAMHPVMSDEQATRWYKERIKAGTWRSDTYPPPPHYFPDGIATPRTLPNLTRRMLERGFKPEDVRKVLGLNWMRVYRQVFGA